MSAIAEPDIDQDTFTILMEGVEWSEDQSCDYTDCDVTATHMLVCGVCYTGREFMCGEHAEATAAARLEYPEEKVIFDKTCQHSPELGNCVIEPLER